MMLDNAIFITFSLLLFTCQLADHCGDDLGLDEIHETQGACRGDGWPRKKPSKL